MSELKSCPFCGGEAKLHFLEKEHPFVYRVACVGECKTAYGSSYSYSEKYTAIKQWNTRPEDGEFIRKSDMIELVKGVCNVLEFLKLDEKVSTKNILEQFNNLESHSVESGGLREELKLFASCMEETLKQNDHKTGWKTMYIGDLLIRLREETEELEQAIISSKTADKSLVKKEACDVANFAMMIFDICHNSEHALKGEL